MSQPKNILSLRDKSNMVGGDLIRKAIMSEPMVEGVRIINTGESTYHRKRLKNPLDLSTDILHWTTPLFVKFIFKLYRDRYGKPWSVNFSAQCNEVLKLKDSITDVVGFCDNEVLRQFLQWFFDNRSDGFLSRASGLFISQMRQDWVLQNFVTYRGFHCKVVKKPEEPILESNPPNIKEMNNVFLLSDEDFVEKYGILLPINWLVAKKEFSLKEALRYVYFAMKRLHKKNQLSKVIEVTELLSPYPNSFLFKDGNMILKKVEPISKELKIEFSNKAVELWVQKGYSKSGI